MIKMKRFTLFCILLLILCLVFSSCRTIYDSTSKLNIHSRSTFLVAGFDDAAENTDVLFTMSYDPSENTAYIAQIPRDTYFEFGKSQNKINQIYASLKASGISSDAALKNASDMIGEAFGVTFDGYIGITIDTFTEIVDAIGGVDIEVSDNMVLSLDGDEEDLILYHGNNHINGREAEKFVRYRSGYITGDLGRIDAQKIFLNSLFKKLTKDMTLPVLINLVNTFQNKAVTNIKASDVMPLLLSGFKKENKKSFYVTVPGEAAMGLNGISYYVLNRKSAAEIASKYMYATVKFDSKRIFCDFKSDVFKNIYEDDSIGYIEYSNDHINDLRIKSGKTP